MLGRPREALHHSSLEKSVPCHDLCSRRQLQKLQRRHSLSSTDGGHLIMVDTTSALYAARVSAKTEIEPAADAAS